MSYIKVCLGFTRMSMELDRFKDIASIVARTDKLDTELSRDIVIYLRKYGDDFDKNFYREGQINPYTNEEMFK